MLNTYGSGPSAPTTSNTDWLGMAPLGIAPPQIAGAAAVPAGTPQTTDQQLAQQQQQVAALNQQAANNFAPSTPPANIGAPDTTYTASVNATDVGQAMADLAQFGLSGPDAQNAINWYKQEETALTPPAQMQIDMYNQPWFQKAFPGIIQQIKNGQTPMSPQDYITFKQGVKSFASTFGIPDGFITDQTVADMVGRGWTFDTFTQRMGLAFNASAQAAVNNPEATKLLDQWYGIKPGSGALAAFYLDPQRSVSLLAQATEAARAGASAEGAGFQHIDQATLMGLAANKSLGEIQSGIAAATPLLPTTKAINGPGTPAGLQHPQGPLTEQDLLAAELGNVPGETQLQAQEKANVVIGQRTSAFRGGGGTAGMGAPGQQTGAGFGTQ